LTFAVAACAFSRNSRQSFCNPGVPRNCWNHHHHPSLHSSSFGLSSFPSHSSSSSSSSTTINTMAPRQQEQSVSAAVPVWFQHEVKITAPSRGCHLITGDIQKAIGSDLSKIKIGMCNLFIQVSRHSDFSMYGK
jgi:hypothetical protein